MKEFNFTSQKGSGPKPITWLQRQRYKPNAVVASRTQAGQLVNPQARRALAALLCACAAQQGRRTSCESVASV
ncbi:unnamed protein product [Pleuronectes platessa]|uniref:Uncharacterized protein n=1 Tax=Pleuronectes platessa TaxID=8262 RepID=A0A9N7YZK6_PLEPL|nr:unnamed protein product [Pleuronectes platessa]